MRLGGWSLGSDMLQKPAGRFRAVQGVDLSRSVLRKSLRMSVDMREPVLRPLRLLRAEGLTRINLVEEIHIFLCWHWG